MKKIVLAIALVGVLGLVTGCSALGCGSCEPDPCCEPVYVSPCCPAPSQGIGYDNAAAPAGGGGGGASCGGAGASCG